MIAAPLVLLLPLAAAPAPNPPPTPATRSPVRRYHALMKNALTEIHRAVDRHEDFDIVIDAGQPIAGDRKLVRVSPNSSPR